jgi:hypothetical protein
MATDLLSPQLYHPSLKTTFNGVVHPPSTPNAQVHNIEVSSLPPYPPVSDVLSWKKTILRFTMLLVMGTLPLALSLSISVFNTWLNVVTFRAACHQTVFPGKFENLLSGVSPGHIQKTGIDFPFVFDEFECLNLNITKSSSTKAGDNLPVMVYIHGYYYSLSEHIEACSW